MRLIFLVVATMLLAWGCKDGPEFNTDPGFKLDIKADTMVFDTVFTSPSPGVPMSVNKQFVVVNPGKEPVLASFQVAGGSGSTFRINVDGTSGNRIDDVEILGKDSVFVFVELSVDPNRDPQALPLIVRDSILIHTNGDDQKVQLVAWGQDAHYIFRDSLCNARLDDKLKPYVVYGYLYVPENCELTIGPGVRLHFAPRSWLFVEGTLKIEGTVDEPVRFEGDRLEPDYEEVAGQWGGIWFGYPSKANRIRHARIKNGTVGIYCDSSSVDGNYVVEVYNTEVRNMSFDGLSGRGSSLMAENSVFVNCARFTFLGLYGGDYLLRNCTFATFNFEFPRRDPTFALNNIERDQLGNVIATYPVTASFRNNIIYGSLDNEFALDLDENKVGPLEIQNNLIRTELSGLDVPGADNVVNEDPRFLAPRSYNFDLDTLSAAKDIGRVLTPVVNTDFLERTRDAKPDAGAFESRF
ncbi:MAG: hypothetical protein H6606_01560 [Flavobacteriales bacterium]|nr:hypothetical protein [Flavobacteriales bacterium]